MTLSLDEVRAALARHSGAELAPLIEPLLEELWSAPDGDGGGWRAVDALAPSLLERGLQPSAAIEAVLAAGRALVERAEDDGRLDGPGARRMAARIDRAAVELARAVEQARGERRQSFLAFLVHELKNPLNTILNALWLLREKGTDAQQAPRFLELAERAVRRLEGRARDLRELDETLVNPPPGWEAARHPGPNG